MLQIYTIMLQVFNALFESRCKRFTDYPFNNIRNPFRDDEIAKKKHQFRFDKFKKIQPNCMEQKYNLQIVISYAVSQETDEYSNLVQNHTRQVIMVATNSFPKGYDSSKVE